MPRSSRPLVVSLAALGLLATVVEAHDLFFKPAAFRLEPNARTTLTVLNGTFERSENAVTPDRLADLSLVGPGGRAALPHADWTRGPDSTSRLALAVGTAGTYVVGASIRPRILQLKGPAFTGYLREEGLDAVIAERRRTGTSASPARERYAKHIKAVLQVGESATDAGSTVFGYPAELITLNRPTTLAVGDTLRVRALARGAGLGGAVILAGGRIEGGNRRIPLQRTTSAADGAAVIRLTHPGRWYVKFIDMQKAAAGDSVDYVSQWATLTFHVRAR
jgi:hypothetical protein